MKFLVVPLMVVLLSSCSALDVATGAYDAMFTDDSGGISVDTELVVGDKKQEVQVGNRTGVVNNTAESISITETDYFLILLMLLGWLLPSPSEMWREIKSWFTK